MTYECFGESVILIIYTDDTIVTGPNVTLTDAAIRDIGNKFEVTSKDSVDDFLGVKVARNDVEKLVSFTQPHLIQSILDSFRVE
jgi:hypothetical protein